jgi:uncharacterized protein (TIGR00255 family)
MTGFARAQGRDDGGEWVWEAKSVNGRGLDLRCRLPAGFDRLELAARTAAARHFKRGNIALTLSVTQAGSGGGYRINMDAALGLATAAAELARRSGLPPPTVDGLLTVRGVVEVSEDETRGTPSEDREAAVGRSLDEVLAALAGMRAEEGARLQTVLLDQLDEAERLRQAAAACAGAQPGALRRRLNGQLAELLEAVPALTEERLAQELAILAGRSDVREEIDRFGAHLSAARELLLSGGAVGRRLDFLCQELNREANTLCSKAADLELTGIGLDLKVLVEQFREHVQTIE